MALIKAAPLDQLPPGTAMHLETGEGAIAICNVEGEIHAINGICPHAGGPLGYGGLDGHILTCPYHAWEFDCRTGISVFDEDLRQAKYPVKVEDGQIFVEV